MRYNNNFTLALRLSFSLGFSRPPAATSYNYFAERLLDDLKPLTDETTNDTKLPRTSEELMLPRASRLRWGWKVAEASKPAQRTMSKKYRRLEMLYEEINEVARYFESHS